jgi:Family of unknown function (DUF5895)
MTYSKTKATKDQTAEYQTAEYLHSLDGSTVTAMPLAEDRSPIANPDNSLAEIITVPSAAEVRDRFAAPEYVNQNARLPRIQALRGENGASECGYFITEAEMAKAGWKQIDESETIIYEYNSGGKERGLLIKSPRMLVVPRSPLFAFDRQVSRQEERLVVAGQYNKQLYSDRQKYGTAQCYEVLLLDAENQPLHEIGLAYVAKGANQASFSFHWQQLVAEVTKCHAIANSIPARAKDARFNSLCIFEFTVKRELAGNNAKSPACKVHSHIEPTQANWEQFFLGRQDEIADKLLNLLSPTSELTLPQANVLGLADQVDSLTDRYLAA